MRQACGGAGFLDVSQISCLFQDSAPLPTFEGVNTVMLQQSSRYIFKQAARVMSGEKCEGYFSYFNHLDDLVQKKSFADTPEKFLDLPHLDMALAVRAAYHIRFVWDML